MGGLTIPVAPKIAAFAAGKPVAGKMSAYVVVQSLVLPAGLVGSQGFAATAATASTVFNIQKNEVNIGTATFAISGTVATFALASATSFVPGDRIEIIAPTQDATLADVSFTLLGSGSG